MSLSNERVKEVSLQALKKVYERYIELGSRGLEKTAVNRFGDQALVMDWEAEEIVLGTFEAHSVPINWITEEHGETRTASGTTYNRRLATLDGLDGTDMYRKDWKNGRCGTMLAIGANEDPTYNQVTFSGVVELTTGDIYFASDGASYKVDGINGKATRITTSGRRKLGKDPFIYVDEGMQECVKIFTSRLMPEFQTHNAISSAIHWVDLASGRADIVAEVTRKKNLELLCGHHLVKNAGGEVISVNDGLLIGLRSCLEWGQGEKERIGFIAAATPELAQELLTHINR